MSWDFRFLIYVQFFLFFNLSVGPFLVPVISVSSCVFGVLLCYVVHTCLVSLSCVSSLSRLLSLQHCSPCLVSQSAPCLPLSSLTCVLLPPLFSLYLSSQILVRAFRICFCSFLALHLCLESQCFPKYVLQVSLCVLHVFLWIPACNFYFVLLQ